MNLNFDNLMTVAECDKYIEMFQKLGDVPKALVDRRDILAKQGISVYRDFTARHRPSKELADCIERAADALLKPGLDAAEALKPVLLYGKIQSGKTRAFVGVMSIAFDRGVDIIVVYTKGTNALDKQTVSRMQEEFDHFKPTDNLNQQCTIAVHDVHNLGTRMLTDYELNTQKHVIVCMKEANNTQSLKEIFASSMLMRQKRVVVIDDEADFGGIAFYRDSRAGGVKAGKNALNITKTVQSIPDCRNMLVTATPYSLYLQPDGMAQLINGEVRPLKPRHTEMVPVHDQYVGGKQYFTDSARPDSMFHSVFHPLSQECVNAIGKSNRHYLNNISKSPNLQDFRFAVIQYLVGTAIRSIQEMARGILYRSSFILHADTSKDAHEWQRELMDAFLNYLGQHVFCDQPDDRTFDSMIGVIYEDFAETRRNGEAEGLLEKDMMPSLMEVIGKIKDLFVETKIHVQIVNSDEDVENLLDETGQLALRHEANIFIGGSIIDRGLTIENLIGFVYGRSPQQMQMDTVLQHARMYGARKMADMAVTRFHTTNLLHDRLRRINAMDESLRDQFEQAMRDGRDPTSLFICRDAKGQINPCAPSKLLISSISTIAPHSRHLPVGFQTDCQTTIQKVISEIDSDILRAPDYQNRDGDGIFMMDRDLAIAILRRIRSTYIYNRPIDANKGLEWDVDETIGVLEWALDKETRLYCLRRENREMSRCRTNGGFIDAPDDGRTDLAPARAKAIDLPLLMLIKENGTASKGWRDAPFYWPVLLVQKNVRAAVYGNEGK
ncbi:MAG: hypothetical protein IJQ73_16250 [Kiritimatiellae bacterium]|nr:hypothetical protein [Kiritimatiellia bacterium]